MGGYLFFSHRVESGHCLVSSKLYVSLGHFGAISNHNPMLVTTVHSGMFDFKSMLFCANSWFIIEPSVACCFGILHNGGII